MQASIPSMVEDASLNSDQVDQMIFEWTNNHQTSRFPPDLTLKPPESDQRHNCIFTYLQINSVRIGGTKYLIAVFILHVQRQVIPQFGRKLYPTVCRPSMHPIEVTSTNKSKLTLPTHLPQAQFQPNLLSHPSIVAAIVGCLCLCCLCLWLWCCSRRQWWPVSCLLTIPSSCLWIRLHHILQLQKNLG